MDVSTSTPKQDSVTDIPPLDTAILCLGVLAHLHERPVTEHQLRHEFTAGLSKLDVDTFRRSLADLGLSSKIKTSSLNALSKKTLPVVAVLDDDRYALLIRIDENQVLLQTNATNKAECMDFDTFQDQWTGKIIETEAPTKQSYLNNGMKNEPSGNQWLLKTMWKYRSLMREALLASCFIQIFALVSPLVFMVVVDKVLSHKNLSTLDVLIFALAVISTFEVLLSWLRSYLLSHSNHRVDSELNAHFIRHMLHLPVSFFESRSTGDVLARIKELESVRHFITGSALTSLLDVLFVFIFLGVMFVFSPELTAIVALILPVFLLISIIMGPLMRKKLEDKFIIGAQNQAFLVETVANIKTVKGSAAEPLAQHQWEQQLTEYLDAGFRGSQHSNTINQTVALISKGSIVLVLYFGASLVIEGSLTVGQLIAFNMLSARVNAPILRLAQIWQDLQQMRTSMRRLEEVLKLPIEPSFNPNRTPLPNIEGRISFEDVNFRYRPEAPEAIRNLRLDIKKGEVLGIMGESGSGKSTVIKLLRRFYSPDQGRIIIDNIDIAGVDSAWLRGQIGVVSIDDVLFNRRIIDNIRGGDSSLDVDRCIEAAKLAGAHPFILELPEAYDTVVGERGNQLSAGQQQRILIARALAMSPPILALDEATNFLDLESEMRVQQNLKGICAGRTVIISSHRPSILRNCDRIIELKNGQIVDEGTPNDILKKAIKRLARHSPESQRVDDRQISILSS